MPQQIILFDINETILNLGQLKPKFKQYFGNELFLDTWFSMLLHSSTVCLTTKVETNFKDLALANLNTLAGRLDKSLTTEQRSDIISSLANLPAHDDIKPALVLLRSEGFKLVAFSNSSETLLRSQLNNAGLTDYFDNAISVESAKTFKPSQDAYQFAIKKLNTASHDVTLVAAHDWDTHGALCAGLSAAFIDRFNAQYNPTYKEPEIIGNTMGEVAVKLIESKRPNLTSENRS
ncbi:haloacid dehalogenase type II [Agarivorans sp. Alg241-V36]|uniref:haloacid dehalogenase type II n=1 Tax=Agarivorans sp. Alg241-V36 TaxID=2305992 RepID=UPI0013D1774A|nr:haloacid dehalogenase type II [Agarivorans sp. Alg241-V36]